MNKKTILILISSVTLVLDYLTKKIVVDNIALHDRIEVLPFLNIVYVENRGAAFGMFAGLGNNVFILIALAAIIIIFIYASKVQKGIELIALSLILGGAAGNLLDRIRIGKVVDFIDIYIKNWHWPAFNVADSALTIGIAILIWHNFMHVRPVRDNRDN